MDLAHSLSTTRRPPFAASTSDRARKDDPPRSMLNITAIPVCIASIPMVHRSSPRSYSWDIRVDNARPHRSPQAPWSGSLIQPIISSNETRRYAHVHVPYVLYST